MPMPKLTDLDPARAKLLDRKIGTFLGWQAPKIVALIGPSDPTVFDQFLQKCEEVAVSCVNRLQDYSDKEIETISSDRSPPAQIKSEWIQFETGRIDRLHRSSPPWYAGGLGHPAYVANFEYWAKMPHFSVQEMTCICSGLEPGSFDFNDLMRTAEKDPAKAPAALAFLHSQKVLLTRKFSPYSYQESIDPIKFLDWCEQVEFSAHPELLRLLRQYHIPKSKPGKPQEPVAVAVPHQREVDTIAQIFTALAIRELGYDPTQPRSPIPSEISDMAAHLGLKGTDETVRKYLKLGASFLPKDWKPD